MRKLGPHRADGTVQLRWLLLSRSGRQSLTVPPSALLPAGCGRHATQLHSAARTQVRSCGLLLTGGKTYCIKKRTCTAHMTAESVLLDDDCTPHRFCQQCGKFEVRAAV